jgi:hypothetical protein
MTEFNAGWDAELATEMLPIWVTRQYIYGSLIEVDELVGVLDAILRCGPSANIPTVAVVPRAPA